MFCQPLHTLEHERDMYIVLYPPVGEIIARWSAALLVGYQGDLTSSPTIWASDSDGHLDRIPFDIHGASIINIRSVAGGFDKSLVVGGNAVSADSRRAGFVAWISPDRERRKIIQTEPFRAEAVALDANGVIWAAGHTVDPQSGLATASSLVYRYDPSGGLLSSVQLRDPDGTESGFAEMSSHLMASKDRVGWLTSATEYVEFTLDGTIRDRFAPPWKDEKVRGAAALPGWGLSDNGDVVLEKRPDERKRIGILALDRIRRVWVPVALPAHSPEALGMVLGFDRATLVLVQSGSLERLAPARFMPPAARVERALVRDEHRLARVVGCTSRARVPGPAWARRMIEIGHASRLKNRVWCGIVMPVKALGRPNRAGSCGNTEAHEPIHLFSQEVTHVGS